jgi:hypothetical protein
MRDGDGNVAHAWIEVDGRAFNALPVTGTFVSQFNAVAPPDDQCFEVPLSYDR